jgi:hypothetical protein
MEIDLTQKTPLVLVRELERPTSSTLFVVAEDFVVGDFTVPKGMATDLASVPVPFRNLISQLTCVEGAILHDHLYKTGVVRRKVADKIFFEMLKDAVPAYKRYLIYWALRLGGASSYKG